MPTTITPYLLYEDVAGALDWLARVFGFEEVLRFDAPDGSVNHAEMKLGDGSIMLGDPGPDYRNPKRVGERTSQLYVYVDDVDAHYERAKEAGAKIKLEPTDQEYGDRRYVCGMRASSAAPSASRTGTSSMRSSTSWKKPRTIRRSASLRGRPRAIR